MPSPKQVSQVKIGSEYYNLSDPKFAESAAAGITMGDITVWNNKSDFSGSYNDLTDKPEISGNNTYIAYIVEDITPKYASGNLYYAFRNEEDNFTSLTERIEAGQDVILCYQISNGLRSEDDIVIDNYFYLVERSSEGLFFIQPKNQFDAIDFVSIYVSKDGPITGYNTTVYSPSFDEIRVNDTITVPVEEDFNSGNKYVNLWIPVNVSQLNNDADYVSASGLTTYVAKTDVTPTTGITGTAIATIGGKTIYAPVAEGGLQTETDPIFNASAAAGISATDIANWNAATTGFVPVTTTNGNVKTQFITQSSTTGMTLRISDGNPNTHQALLRMESTNESYPKTKAQLLADDILIQGTTLTLQGVKTPTNNTDAANKKYVDDQISSVTTGLTNYVPKEVAGGTITFVPGEFAVDIQDQNENLSSIAATTNSVEILVGEGATESAAAMMMSIHNDGSHLNLSAQHLIISSNDTYISGVRIPTSNLDAANKKYVDDQITAAVTPYVEKSSVISTGPTNGTAIANVAGITIYAPVAEGGVTVESDPVFTSWATGSGVAAYTITAADVANWNAKSSTTPVNADWNATSGLSTILNKPSIPNAASFTTTYDSRYANISHTHNYATESYADSVTSSLGSAATTSITDYAAAGHTHDGYATIQMISGFANISDIPYITPEGSGSELIATITQNGSSFGLYAPVFNESSLNSKTGLSSITSHTTPVLNEITTTFANITYDANNKMLSFPTSVIISLAAATVSVISSIDEQNDSFYGPVN